MVMFVSDPANYIDNGMSVEVNGGAGGMGSSTDPYSSYRLRVGSPGLGGQQYMNGVVV